MERLTVNGLHLNDVGNRVMARVIAGALVGGAALARVPVARVSEVAQAAAQKHHFVAEVTRPENADLCYGMRWRADEYAAEIPCYHQMIQATEAIVHELAASPWKNETGAPRCRPTFQGPLPFPSSTTIQKRINNATL